jgi:hypothetical protein
MVVSSFMGGLMLVAIAFLGEYVWRILDEVRGAPPFIEARHEHAARGEPRPRQTAPEQFDREVVQRP